MTELIIAIIVGVIQIILSINLIVRQKNVIAIISEVISSFILLLILNGLSANANTISWVYIGLALLEYVFVKVFLVGFMAIARSYSFYATKSLCKNKNKKKKKKVSSLKLKFIRTFNKVKYWPRLKLGLPGMADKKHPKTGVKFDSKGFPIFKPYYTVKLKRKYFHEARDRHFYMANKILCQDVKSSHRVKAKFSKKQIAEILSVETPSGYTWHHHQDAGILQLVDEEIHAKTRHDGGYSIWGGK